MKGKRVQIAVKVVIRTKKEKSILMIAVKGEKIISKCYRQWNFNFNRLMKRHFFHLVNPSPWPFLVSLGLLFITSGLAFYMHSGVFGWFCLSFFSYSHFRLSAVTFWLFTIFIAFWPSSVGHTL